MRGFAAVPVLLVLVLLVAGVFAYFNLQSAKNTLVKPVPQTESLPIYKNEKLGFELQYSQNLKVLEDSEEEFNQRGGGNFRKNFSFYVGYEPGGFVGAMVVLEKEDNFETNPFSLWVFNNLNNLAIEQWHHDYWYYPFVWGDFTYTGKFILAPQDIATVSGQIGKSGVIDYREGKPKFIYIAKDQKMYLFRIIGQKGEEILRGFKFL